MKTVSEPPASFLYQSSVPIIMDKKSMAIIAVVVVAVAAASYLAMQMDDTRDSGQDADGYTLSLKLSLKDGLKCFMGDREYVDGDTIVLYSDAVLKFVAPQLGTISCSASWSDPYGYSTGGSSGEEYATSMDLYVSWAAFFDNMTGNLNATFHAGE